MAGKSTMRGKTEAMPKRLSVDELVAFMSLPIFHELRTAVDVGILLFGISYYQKLILKIVIIENVIIILYQSYYQKFRY